MNVFDEKKLDVFFFSEPDEPIYVGRENLEIVRMLRKEAYLHILKLGNKATWGTFSQGGEICIILVDRQGYAETRGDYLIGEGLRRHKGVIKSLMDDLTDGKYLLWLVYGTTAYLWTMKRGNREPDHGSMTGGVTVNAKAKAVNDSGGMRLINGEDGQIYEGWSYGVDYIETKDIRCALAIKGG